MANSHNHSHNHSVKRPQAHSHNHGAQGHQHSENGAVFALMLVAAVVIFLLSFIPIKAIPQVVYNVALAVATIAAGIPVFFAAVKNASKLNIDENVLMTIAVLAASVLGEFREAAAVAIFFRVGEMMEDFASERSRKSIRAISEIQPDTANVMTSMGQVKKVKAQKVKVGTAIVIYPHERVPIDCVIIQGNSMVNKAAITGESIPVTVQKGDQLLSGTINGNNTITAKTVNTLEESAASRIIKMVEKAGAKKSNTQKLITRIANYYTPAVVFLAVIVALVPSIVTGEWAKWIHRALVLLVASCPCALVLCVPLGIFTGIGSAARKGVLVKGGKYIERLADAKCVAFDKTGTLTTDELKVGSVMSPIGLDRDAVLTLAAVAEGRSTHPIANAIRAAAPRVNTAQATDYQEFAGCGSRVNFGGKKIICGGKKLLHSYGIDTEGYDGIMVAVDNKLVGVISVESEVRKEAETAIKDLRNLGITHISMLTGDNESAAKAIAKGLDIDDFYADLLPDNKLKVVEQMRKKYGKVIYVGDGINDAPVLAASDVGVGMGLGSQAANEAADVVLVNNSLEKLSEARQLSLKTMRILKGNIFFIMAVKAVVIVLGILGIAPMWLAVFADVGVCLISVIVSSFIASDDIKYALKSLLGKGKI